MKLKTLAVIIPLHALALCGLVILHQTFTLPVAQVEGVDLVTLPGERVQLTCVVGVDPPWPRSMVREGCTVCFRHGSTVLGKNKTNDAGIATVAYTAGDKDQISNDVTILLELELEEEFAYQQGDPDILVRSYSDGVMVYVCDIGSTFKSGIWADVDPRYPESWKVDPDAVDTLYRLAGRASCGIVYVAPGTIVRSAAVRRYLRRNQLPRAPVLFPEAPPLGQSLSDFVAGLKEKWRHVRCGVTRRKELAQALQRNGIEAVIVNAPPGQIHQGAKVTFVRSWTEVK